MAASCFTHPIDLLKVHLQTSKHPNTRLLPTALAIVRERGILGLYSGLSAALLRQATYTMSRFAIYDIAKDLLRHQDNTSLSGGEIVLATALSGVAGGVVGNPAEIMNVRMQNDQALPPYMRRNYRSALHGLAAMVRMEGLGSLAIGLGPSLVRATLATGSQFVTYDAFKDRLLMMGYPDTVPVHFMASFAAGLVATTACSPVDVVKSRTMAALRSQTSSKNTGKAPSMWTTMVTIYRNEGVRAFFKGWVPSYVRLCPQLVMTFVIYERLRKLYFSHYL